MASSSLTRRQLLGSAAAGAALACSKDPERPDRGRAPDAAIAWEGVASPDPVRFPVGATSGDPHPDGMVLATRYTGSSDLSVVVARWDGTYWDESEARPVAAFADGFVHLVIDGLAPDEQIAFQFVDGQGRASAVGVGRTAPDETTLGAIRLLATSCSKARDGGWPTFDHAVARGPLDLAIWVGDTVYAYDLTLDEFRATWQQYLSEPQMQTALGAASHVFIWDDHEVTNNWDSETVDPVLFANASRAFFDFLPIRRDPEHEGRLWRKIAYGPLLDVFVLDCRGERRPSRDAYISAAQRDWLIDGVRSSTAQWKIIVNSVPITRFPALFSAVDEVLQDRWEGYPGDREAVLSGLDGIEGVLWLSGDFHLPALTRIEPDGPRARVFEILTGPVGSNPNPLGQLMWQTPDANRAQFPWSASVHTATRIDVHAEECLIEFIGNRGESWMLARIGRSGELLEIEVTEPE